jgi:hypothetical protein
VRIYKYSSVPNKIVKATEFQISTEGYHMKEKEETRKKKKRKSVVFPPPSCQPAEEKEEVFTS